MPDWISAISDAVVALSAGAVAFFAWRGVSAWRRELHGRTEYELARRVLIGVHRVRNAIQHVRVPGTFAYEWRERPGRKPDSAEVDADDESYAYKNRWEPLQQARDALELDILEAEAIWGNALVAANKKLQKCIGELNACLMRHLRTQKGGNLPDSMSAHQREKIQGVIENLGTDESPDDFTKQITDAVQAFRHELQPHLKL